MAGAKCRSPRRKRTSGRQIMPAACERPSDLRGSEPTGGCLRTAMVAFPGRTRHRHHDAGWSHVIGSAMGMLGASVGAHRAWHAREWRLPAHRGPGRRAFIAPVSTNVPHWTSARPQSRNGGVCDRVCIGQTPQAAAADAASRTHLLAQFETCAAPAVKPHFPGFPIPYAG
jgi:hypothetical protein